MDTFRVRSMTKSMTQDEAWWMWDRAIKLGWEITYGDPEAFWAVGETGYFVGELNGTIISCVGLLKYSDSFAYVSMYIVDEEYRGKGYGLKTFNAVMQSIPSGCNVGLMASTDHEAMYQRSGFKQYWRVLEKLFNISELASIDCTQPNNVIIHPISSNTSTVIVQAITDYDSKCFFTARSKYVKERIFSVNETKRGGGHFVALDNTNGTVVGLIVVKQPISDKVSSYQVGPFYADNVEIASCLLHCACSYLMKKGLVRQEICIFHPENNPNAIVLSDTFKAVLDDTILFMSTSVPPSYSVEYVYGISAPSTG